ncbi:MAG: hypothetical protein ACJ757_10340 [Gaiellaceae bacterium]
MPVKLTPEQRRVATRFSRLVRDFSGEALAMEIGVAAQQAFGEPHFAQLLIQLQLKHVEMSKALIASFRAGLFAPAAGLTRPLLEGAAKLSWAAIARPEERRARLLRILVTAYIELEEEGVALPPGELALREEAARLNLGPAPDARSAMQAVDALARRLELPPFLEDHYQQFGLSSQQLHVHLAGPAVFAVDRERQEMVIYVEPRVLLGFSSLRWAIYYFAFATQSIAMLVGLDDLRARIVRRYNAIVGEAEAEVARLTAAGQP